MATIRPFTALRPHHDRAAQVAAVPYDVVNTEEARSLAGEAGKSAESQRGDQDAGRAGNRCRVLDQLSDWLFEVVDTKAQLACIAIGAALLGTLGAPAFAETQGCKEPTTGAKDAPVFSPPLAKVMTGSGRLQFY